jgi:hypothetical protein
MLDIYDSGEGWACYESPPVATVLDIDEQLNQIPIRGRALPKKYWGDRPILSADQDRLGSRLSSSSKAFEIDEDYYTARMFRANRARRAKRKGSRLSDKRRGIS